MEIESCSNRNTKHLNSSSRDGDCLKLPFSEKLGAAVWMGGQGAMQLLSHTTEQETAQETRGKKEREHSCHW